MLSRSTALAAALGALEGRQEWGVKLLVDRERSRGAARRSPGATPAGRPQRRRRLPAAAPRGSSALREAVDALAAELAEDVHARSQDWAADAVVRPPQNRELSGHEGEMVLNGAYLVERDRADGLRELVAELEERHRGARRRIELTGPWPPYNFVLGCGPRSHGDVAIAERDVALVDLVDRLLGGGVVIAGDITLAVADVDLVHVWLRALISSVATAEEQGAAAEDRAL